MIGKSVDDRVKELIGEIRDLTERALLQFESFGFYSENIETKIIKRTRTVLFFKKLKTKFGEFTIANRDEIEKHCQENDSAYHSIDINYCPIELLYSFLPYCSYITESGYRPDLMILIRKGNENFDENWEKHKVIIRCYVEYADFFLNFKPLPYEKKQIIIGFDGEAVVYTELPHQLQDKIKNILKEG
jgi:hypothetical protein